MCLAGLGERNEWGTCPLHWEVRNLTNTLHWVDILRQPQAKKGKEEGVNSKTQPFICGRYTEMMRIFVLMIQISRYGKPGAINELALVLFLSSSSLVRLSLMFEDCSNTWWLTRHLLLPVACHTTFQISY